MAIERRDQLAGTYGDPDVKLSGSEMSVAVDPPLDLMRFQKNI